MKNKFYRLSLWLGGGLLTVATVALLLWQWNIHTAKTDMAGTVTALRQLTPEPRNAVAEPRRDNTMAVLELENTDYIGILEMPRFGSALPVQAEWDTLTDSPCRYDGNVFEGTLQIGATTQKGQYDFYRELSVGDAVYFTDVTGNRYSYTVTELRYADHADPETLAKNQGEMTLFIKNIYGRQYLIVTCSTPG